jgi:hypothetical protein
MQRLAMAKRCIFCSILRKLKMVRKNIDHNFREYAVGCRSIIAICLVVLAVFYPVLFLDFEYTSDDNWMLLSNSNIWNKDFGYVVRQIFTRFEYGQYSPMNTLLYRGVYQIFGMNSSFFHAIGLLLHILNSLLVYRLMTIVSAALQIKRNKESVLVGALFFAILPVHAEAVSWIAATKILGCTFFSLIAIISFIRNIDKQSLHARVGIFIALLLAFGFKEQAIVTPPLLVAFAALYRKAGLRDAICRHGNWLVLSVIGLYWSYLGSLNLMHVFNGTNITPGFFPSAARPVYCLLFYLFHTFLPFGLSVRYSEPSLLGYGVAMFLGTLLCLAIAKWGWFEITCNFDVLFGLLFFGISMSCFIHIIPLPRPSIAADRYLYFSSIGLTIVLIPIIDFLLQKKVTSGLFFAYLSVLAFVTFERCQNWSFL